MAVVLEHECVCLCSQSGCYPMPLSLRSQLWLRVIEHSFDWKWSEHCVMSHLSTPCYPSLSGRWRGLTSCPAPCPLKELAIISALPLCTPQATTDNWVCVRNRCERPSCFFFFIWRCKNPNPHPSHSQCKQIIFIYWENKAMSALFKIHLNRDAPI